MQQVRVDASGAQAAAPLPRSPYVRSITPRNILSFANDTEPLELLPLNILVGPNGSGKSNLLEVIALLRSTVGSRSSDLDVEIAEGGGATEWIWKGNPHEPATIEVVIALPEVPPPVRHVLAFRPVQQDIQITDERIEYEQALPGHEKPYFFYRYQKGRPKLHVFDDGRPRLIDPEKIDLTRSVLAQFRDPERLWELTSLAELYENTRLYREWQQGRNSILRRARSANLRADRLEEDFSNLGLVLNRIRRQPDAKAQVLAGLRDLYEGLDDFDVSVQQGTVQVFLTEGKYTIPAPRLSDGTLRFLCLLALLCDPTPPPLLVIEEPELGLHPDLIPKVRDLMVAASERAQIIATTHSDILVDALTDTPEVVAVFEKHQGRTKMKRLDRKSLQLWLEKYRLGELWTRGELGGVRW
jgi:predicted ATPase